MITRSSAIKSTELALKETESRLLAAPTYGVYIHAKQQLELMLSALKKQPLPSQSARYFVDIGLMAAKELEASDPNYADVLMLADYEFKLAEL